MSRYGSFKYGEKKYGSRWITDRTEIDLINNTYKAFLNYTDMNRIEENMQELFNIMRSMGYYATVDTKTDWKNYKETTDIENIPTISHMRRIIRNLRSLKLNFLCYATTPEHLNTMENLTIYQLNDMEKILMDLYNMSLDIQDNYRECGIYECGED